jgi:hypothetical protein
MHWLSFHREAFAALERHSHDVLLRQDFKTGKSGYNGNDRFGVGVTL